jgi:epoxyqueuosine reductase
VTPAQASAEVRKAGRRLGFDRVAVGPADPAAHGEAFRAWLDAGHAGTMAYLGRTREARLDPGRVLPGARTVVACALNYFQGAQVDAPAHVARYAWGEDYHGLLRSRLKALLAEIIRLVPGASGRAYVDTGPLLERDLAAGAGLGWIGKNTMLIHPALGSFFFIGTVLTTAELETDATLPDRCGSCTRCLDACPTGAFRGPYVLDATRCIAYLTIEHRGEIDLGLREGIGGLAFGCDVCQDVCPWNRRAPETTEPTLRAGDVPALEELVGLDAEEYERRLARSPLRRARREGLARNAVVALGNRGGRAAGPVIGAALSHESAVVRGHAAWSLGRRGGPDDRDRLVAALGRESEPSVVAEIDAALLMLEGGGEAEGSEPSC